MSNDASNLWQRRHEAWAFGRAVRDDLLQQFCARYKLSSAPPPALVVDELLTDFLNVRLRYDPLPLNRFAQTQIHNGEVTVTVNALTNRMPGVKDAEGVENVGKWHEIMHVLKDIALLRSTDQPHFPGFEDAPQFTCLRAQDARYDSTVARREFWAEEAGRAAATSLTALAQSGAWLEFGRRARHNPRMVADAWDLLRRAAADIGVNRTALVSQLQYEGRLVVVQEHGRKYVHVQPLLWDL